ncbi:MAG: response regulator transcription factor [Labilithrix sp.]|nr:response regulator transcription factor [Labilithrix sp.]MCW5811614.1 response regulator transcription factor [Labilithrix sp.]
MPRVLVLDGFDESRESTVGVLRSAGFSVVGAAEEDEALEALAKSGVDLVLLDLPVAETIEAASAIRSQCGATTPKILAIIDPTDTAEREGARAAGIDFLILRPCPPLQLVKQARRFLL